MIPVKEYPVTGNGLRAWNIGQVLRSNNIEVVFCANRIFFHTSISSEVVPFSDRFSFNKIIDEINPDAIIFEQGEGLEYIDKRENIHLIADYFAPILAERQYQFNNIEEEVIRLTKMMTKADFFLVASLPQKYYLLSLLLLAGVNCSNDIPIGIVPLFFAEDIIERKKVSKTKRLIFIHAGISWPWLDNKKYLEEFVQIISKYKEICLNIISGSYPYNLEGKNPKNPLRSLQKYDCVNYSDLVTYESLQEIYLESSVAFDVFPSSIERELSFSFRTMDYLRFGIPVIISSTSYFAQKVAIYNAGWVVNINDFGCMKDIVDNILRNKKMISEKGKNAQKLIKEQYLANDMIVSLIEYLKKPYKLSKREFWCKKRMPTAILDKEKIESLNYFVNKKDSQINKLESLIKENNLDKERLEGKLEGAVKTLEQKDSQINKLESLIRESNLDKERLECDLKRTGKMFTQKDEWLRTLELEKIDFQERINHLENRLKNTFEINKMLFFIKRKLLIAINRTCKNIFTAKCKTRIINSDRLSICLVSEEYPPDTGWGGIGAYMYNLAAGLSKEGHKVTVITLAREKEETIRHDNITVFRINDSFVRGFSKWILKMFKLIEFVHSYWAQKLKFAWLVKCKIKDLVKKNEIDVIECPEYDGVAVFITFFTKIPIVVKIHTPIALNYLLNNIKIDFGIKAISFMEKASVILADSVISPSKQMYLKVKTNWMSYISKVNILPNPIDQNEFKPFNISIEKNSILYTGRLEMRKGVHDLVQAFCMVKKIIPDATLYLAGHDTKTFLLDGKEVFFKDFFEKMNINGRVVKDIKLLGRMNRDELIRILNKSNICVFPSIEFENFPYTCLEAMSCGRPVIVSRCGGFPEMVEDGKNGIIFPKGDTQKLSQAIVNLLKDPLKSQEMGQNGRQRVLNEYSIDAISRRNVLHYKEVIFKKNAKSSFN